MATDWRLRRPATLFHVRSLPVNLDNSASSVLEPPSRHVEDHAHVPGWRASDAAAVITALVILGATATKLLPWNRGNGLGKFTFELLRLLGMVDTAPQRLAHRVGLILLAVLCAIGAAAITRPAGHVRLAAVSLRITGRFLAKWSGVFLVVAAALVPMFNLPGTIFPDSIGRKLLLEFWLLSGCLMALGLSWARRPKTKVFAVAIWCFIVAYCFFLIAPGMVRVPRFVEPELSSAEPHYSVTLAQADRLAAGLQLGSQVNLNYGLIHSLSLGAFERHWGMLDFGEHFRVVQVSQIAFLVVAILACYLWRPNNLLFVLFGALLIGPWVSTSHLAVYYPNQAGGRSFGLAAGVVILLMCRRQPVRWVAVALGAGACFLLLYNPETGLCLSFGYGLFLLSHHRNLSLAQIGGLALRAAMGAVIVFLTVAVYYRVGLGTWPPFSAALLPGFIAKFGQGFGGLPLYFDPLAILIFVHATYVVISSVLNWRLRDLEFDESVKLGLSATILTWASYYVNRPHAWDLWTYQFLYLFLIADFFGPRLLSRLRRLGIGAAIFDFRIASLAFVLVPMLLSVNYSILLTTVFPVQRPEITFATISGVSMPEDSANVLRAQANYLLSQESSSTLFFTRHSYSLSILTRRFNPLPVQDVFGETITNSDFESLVREIYRISPRVILFDAPGDRSEPVENTPISFWTMRFFDRLKIRLADRYHPGPTTSGWQVWQLQAPHRKFDVSQSR
jgi:hypothetical protein